MPRRSLPPEVKEAKGTQRAGRDAATPPARVPGVVAVPKGYKGHALTCWKAITDLLAKRHQLTLDSRPALICLCDTYAEREVLKETLEKEGRFQSVKTGSGDAMLRAHPALAAYQDADRRYRAWLIEFGLTDASRGKVNAVTIRPPAPERGKRKAAATVDAPGSRYGLN
jgi:P27 family predicted phage terminase small subunit